MPGIHVSGVLLHAHPERLESVLAQLESAPGVEIQTVTSEGRLVTVVERDTDRELADVFTHMQNTAGVLCASLVYHYSDNDDAAEQEITS
jgi:nitrate reductase NapD